MNMGPTISFYTRTHKWSSRFCLFLWLFHSRQRNTYVLTCFPWLFEGMMSYMWKSILSLFSIRCDFVFCYFPGLSFQLHIPGGTQRSYLGLLVLTLVTSFYSHLPHIPELVWKPAPSVCDSHIPFIILQQIL